MAIYSVFLQNSPMRWDDLSVILAIGRDQTLSAAARRLGVDQTTVARRLAAAEQTLGAKLFGRVGHRLVATESGEIALAHAERVESEVLGLLEGVSGEDNRPAGKVRVTAVPTLVNGLLIPRLGDLLGRFRDLEVELVAEPSNLSLSRREADVAVRLARPTGGQALCRRIGSIGYSCYGPADSPEGPGPWITYDEAHSDLPQAQWVADRVDTRTIRLRVNDAGALVEAVRCGLGRALLPDFLASDDARLARLSGADPELTRDVWLLVHPELHKLARVTVVTTWLRACLAEISQG